MRKKKLLKLSEDLFNRLDAAQLALKEAKQENENLKKEIEILKTENEALKKAQLQSEPLKQLEEKVKKQANISEDAEYGSQIIGKIVITAATYCNKLTSVSENTDVKELVNLILGRTEIAKAEILKIVSSDAEFSQKAELIDTVKNSAEDYFNSVMAQL